jgi:hypothetical protein
MSEDIEIVGGADALDRRVVANLELVIKPVLADHAAGS